MGNENNATLNQGKMKLMVVLLAATLLPLALAMYSLYWNIKSVVEKNNFAFMQSTVEDRHTVIEQFLYERMAMLQVFSRSHKLGELDTDQKVARHFKHWEKTYGNVKSLTVIDNNGTVLSRAGVDVIEKTGNQSADWFVETTKKGKQVSSLYKGPDNKPTIAFVTYNKSFEKKWLLRLTMGLEPLYDILSEFQHAGKEGSYMVDPVTGEYLSTPLFGGNILIDKNEKFNFGKKHYHKDYDYHGAEEVEVGEYINPKGQDVFEAHCCTRRGKWLIIYERGKDVVFRHIRPLLSKIITSFFITSIIIGLSVWYGIKLVLK